MSAGKKVNSGNHRLELEVKGEKRVNKLSNPVPNTNTFNYNQTPNPELYATREPYNTEDPNIGYEVRQYTPVNPNSWNMGSGDGTHLLIWRGLTYIAPGLVSTSTSMTARPGERWAANFMAGRIPSPYAMQTVAGTWKVALGAYNGTTYLSDVASIQFTTFNDDSYGSYATTHVALTPAGTTNVRWRFYNVTDQTNMTLYLGSLNVTRKFESAPGWTNVNNALRPLDASWGYGPTVFQTFNGTGTHYHTSNEVVCAVGAWASAGFDFQSGSASVRLRFLNASNVQVGTASSQTFTTGNTKVRVNVKGQAPTGTTKVVMDVITTNNTQWDAAVLVPDWTTSAAADQHGFKETSGFAVTNKIINPLGTTATNGWTPQGSAGLLSSSAQGLQWSINVDTTYDYRTPSPVSIYSNTAECAPGNWVSFQTRLYGRGFVKFRYQWLTALDAHISYSEFSGGNYMGNENFFGAKSLPSGGIAYGDTMQVPANAFRVRIHIHLERSVSMDTGPFSGWDDNDNFGVAYNLTQTDARLLVGETMGGVTGVPNSETITWLNMFNSTTTVEIHRGELDPGVLTARIADSTLDPNTNISVRPDAKVRYMVLRGDGTWQPLFTGELRDINVEYPYQGKAIVNIQAIDNIRTLNNETVNFGVPTLGALVNVMSGSDVPSVISASDATTNTKVNGEVTSRLDQIILTRDTQKGFAFVDKANTLQIRGRTQQTALANKVSFWDKAGWVDVNDQTYGTAVNITNSSSDVINAVEVETLTWNGTATVKTVSPVYTNGTSINDWGLRKVKVTLNGGTGAPTAQTWATDVMTMHANPVPTVNELEFRGDDNYLAWDRAVNLELYDNVRVRYSRINLDRQYLVQELHHVITPAGWTVKVVFRNNAGLATLLSVNLGT